MIRHAVLFAFRDDVAAADRDAMLADVACFPDHHPLMRRFAIGPNTSRRDRSFSHMMVIDFDTRADLDAYLDSERHEVFVRDRFAPLVAARAIATLDQD